jgi:hypothetical protein
VLRTMLDKNPGLGTGMGDVRLDPRDATGDRATGDRDVTGSGNDRPGEREPALAHAGSSGNWEHIFGAIAKEAMHSMGWTEKGAPASMR